MTFKTHLAKKILYNNSSDTKASIKLKHEHVDGLSNEFFIFEQKSIDLKAVIVSFNESQQEEHANQTLGRSWLLEFFNACVWMFSACLPRFQHSFKWLLTREVAAQLNAVNVTVNSCIGSMKSIGIATNADNPTTNARWIIEWKWFFNSMWTAHRDNQTKFLYFSKEPFICNRQTML